MEADFIRKRITELRMKRGVSEYKMSRNLGHNGSYIQHIVAGNTLPSLTELLYICEYLEVTPSMFFDERIADPALIDELEGYARTLCEDDLKILLAMAKRMRNQRETAE